MHSRDRSAMGRGDHSGQRHGLRTVMLSLMALIAIAGALVMFGCPGDKDEPVVRSANLVSSQEVPPVAVPSSATGNVTLTISADRTRIDYRVVMVPPFTSDVTMSHIHVGPAGVAGPIFLFFCTNLGNAPSTVPVPQACPTAGGTITGTLTAADVIPVAGVSNFTDALSQILSNNTYSNVHTVRNAPGEIRGQNTP